MYTFTLDTVLGYDKADKERHMASDLEAIQKLFHKDETKPVSTFWKVRDDRRTFDLIDMYTGDVVTTVGGEPAVKNVTPYTPDVGRLICDLIREGWKVSEICRQRGMPTVSQLYLWRKNYPDFAELMNQSRVDSADYYFEKALDRAESDMSKEEVPAAKLAVDTYKWAAEKSNPKKFGSKVEVDNKLSGNVGLYVLNTGINRGAVNEEVPGEDQAIKTDAYTVEEKD